MPNAIVTVFRDAEATPVATTATGPDGRYSVNTLAAGTYDLLVATPGYRPTVIENVVLSGNAQTANLNLPRASNKLTGRLTDVGGAGLIDALLAVKNAQGRTVARDITGFDGQYEIRGLAPGTYSLLFKASGYESYTRAGVVVGAGNVVVPDNVLAFVAVPDPWIPTFNPIIDGARIASMIYWHFAEKNPKAQRGDGDPGYYVPPSPPAKCKNGWDLWNKCFRYMKAKESAFETWKMANKAFDQTLWPSIGLFVTQLVDLGANIVGTIALTPEMVLRQVGESATTAFFIYQGVQACLSTYQAISPFLSGGHPFGSWSDVTGFMNSVLGAGDNLVGLEAFVRAVTNNAALSAYLNIPGYLAAVFKAANTILETINSWNALEGVGDSVLSAQRTYDRALMRFRVLLHQLQNLSIECDGSDVDPEKPPKPPDDAGDDGGGGTTIIVRPTDPNEKYGPAGFGAAKFITGDQPLPYTINFENISSATAPAQKVQVYDNLDADLDPRSFRLGEIVFSSTTVTVPEGRSFYHTRLELDTSPTPILADITAGLDIQNNRLFWILTAIDPETGLQPEDPRIGLIPPNDASHRGEGRMTFTISPKATVASGAEIRNAASIQFDTHEIIMTNEVSNTIDFQSPHSAVAALPAQTVATSFTITWAGDDGTSGSGLKDFDVYVSDNDGPFTAWQSAVTHTSAQFSAVLWHTYKFYSVARDNVDNLEAAPAVPDATVRVVLPDTEKPRSAVEPLAATQSATTFTVRWSGTDDVSGIADYTIYASRDGGAFEPWLTNTTATLAVYTGLNRHTYAFYSIARDNSAKVENAPADPDAETIIRLPGSATINVPDDYGVIQPAINVAFDGDEIVVSTGTYVENLNFLGKSITLRSTAPTSPAVVAATILDGGRAGSVVTFAGGEPSSCMLTGFTIRNGLASRGGGVLGNAARATISHARITSNTALISGGAAYGFHGLIQNTIIEANSAQRGGALAVCNGLLRNDTIHGNAATVRGGGLTACTGTITNCIIWDNTAPARASIDNSSIPTYSCIEGWTGGGTGNLANDPRLVDPANGDFRLAADSPCIDAGGAALGLDSDFKGDWRPSDGTRSARGDGSDYDIGADEYAALAFVTDVDPVLVPEGAMATLRLKLSTRPPARLRALVSRASGDSNIAVTGAVEFLFTPEAWSAWQSVTLTAAEDADTSNGQATIRIRLYRGPAGAVPDAFVAAVEQDDDVVAPTILAEPVFTSGTANTLYWQAPPFAIEHYLEWSENSDFAVIETSGWITETFFTVDGIADADALYYRVKSRRSATGEGPWSNVVSSTQDATPPATRVTSPKGRLVQPGAIVPVAFAATESGSGLRGVRLYYRKDAAESFTAYGNPVTASPIAFDTRATGGRGTYEFQTIGVDNVGNLEGAPPLPDATAEILINTPPTFTRAWIEPAPAFASSTLSVRVEGWSDANGDSQGYRYYWKKNGTGIPGASSPTLSAVFVVGDAISCRLTAWDGIQSGTSTETQAIRIVATEHRLVTSASPAAGGSVSPTSATMHPYGSQVVVRAAPNSGWTFSRWSGSSTSTSNPLAVIMDRDRTLTALFQRIPGPDLTGRLMNIAPAYLTQGATVTLAGSIINEGTKATTAPIRVEFKAISGWGGVQTFLPPMTLPVPLAAGASFDLASTGPFTTNAALAWSSYTIQMRIDPANAIAESDELDNTAAFAPFWVMPPKANLQVRNFDFAPQDVATSGGAITFAGQILNGGLQHTSGTYKIEFRISPVPYFRALGAELCGPHTETRSLAPGESLDLATLGEIAVNRLPRGVYSVCISVDRANAVAEQTKADNTAWRLGRKFLYIGGRPTGASGWMLYR